MSRFTEYSVNEHAAESRRLQMWITTLQNVADNAEGKDLLKELRRISWLAEQALLNESQITPDMEDPPEPFWHVGLWPRGEWLRGEFGIYSADDN